MKVLFLLITPPQLQEYSDLYSDLVLEFAANGHNVHVAALLEKRERRETYLEEARGIKILHVKCGNLFGVGPIEKGLTTLSLSRKFTAAIRRFFGGVKFDLVIYPTPPITFGPVVRQLKRAMGCRTYLILRDIFPQNARDLQMIRDPLTFALFRRSERQLYDISDRIGCMSRGNIEYVLRHNRVDPAKLEILYNWQRTREPAPAADPHVRRRLGLDGKFVAVFGGNIGPAQELEFLLQLAALYRHRDDIAFVIVGKGVAKPAIEAMVASGKLANVQLKDHLPRDQFDQLLAAADIGLINLDRRFTIPNIPSKTLAYFAAAIPVLAAVDASTDFGKYLDECEGGLWSITGNLESYQRNFERLLNDRALRQRLGRAARRALIERFTVQQAYKTIVNHQGG